VHLQEMLDGARKKYFFKFDEYRTMLNLQCGVDPSDTASTSKANDGDYNSYVIELHGLEMDNTSK
jgi:exocyst complex component 4